MRVMVLVKATKSSEAGVLPGDPRAPEGLDTLFERMGTFNEELVNAGVLLETRLRAQLEEQRAV
jgi:hypothetical protein